MSGRLCRQSVQRMLTGLESISTIRPSVGGRPGALLPCSLPDSQALVELSLREVETALDDALGKLQSLRVQLTARSLPDHESIDRARHALRGISAAYLKHLKIIQERMVARHQPEGRFGRTIGRLQTQLLNQIDRLLMDQQELGELLAEQNPGLVTDRLKAIAAQWLVAIEQLTGLVQDIRKGDRQPHSIAIGGLRRPEEREDVRDRLAWSLRRWWQTCTVQPGPMTIALIDLHRLASDYPELSRAAAAQLLSAAADLIGSDRRAGRAGVSIDTTVISAEGNERQLAWSCAVIDDQRGQVQSIIAAGLDKTSSRPANSCWQQKMPAGAAAAIAPSLPANGSERRRKQRNPFPYVQLVAPYTGTGLPPTSAFCEALCHDISEDGFSFLSGAMPSTTSLIVALGTRPPHLYMTARVAHFTRCETLTGAKYIVGCQFTGRAMVMAQFG